MRLYRLPYGTLPLAFLTVPAGTHGRVECPCQTFDDFIRVRGSVCGLFLFVQTHAPLIIPPWQSRARKSKFQFLSCVRAGEFSAWQAEQAHHNPSYFTDPEKQKVLRSAMQRPANYLTEIEAYLEKALAEALEEEKTA